MNLPRQARPLLVTFHCGVFFLYTSVFMMSISRNDLESHFSQMGETFIRDMLILIGINFIGYIALWNMRRAGVVLLFFGGIALCWYGFHIEFPILLNFLPLVACLTTAPMWPVLKTP